MNIRPVSKNSLYSKILACIGVAFLLILGVVVVKSQLGTTDIINKKEKETTQIALDVVPRRFFVSRQILSASIGQMVLNERLIEAFARRDRDELGRQASAAVGVLRRSDIGLLYFHLPDNHNFFRAHRPDLHGDDLTEQRPMVAEVNRTRKAVAGWEKGINCYALRHIEPIFYQGEYVGALELGMYLDERILNIWKHAVLGEWFLYSLEDGVSQRIAATVARNDQENLSEQQLAALADNQNLFFRMDRQLVQLIPLPDYRGETGFYLKRIYDNSETIELANNQRNSSILYGLLIAGLGFLAIALLVRFFLRPLEYLAARTRSFAAGNLGETVKVNTNDEIGQLAATMETMRQSLQSSRRYLEESKELFKTLSDVATDWILWQTPQGDIAYTSPACEKITGYSEGELIADPGLVKKMIHPDDADKWLTHYHDALEQKAPGKIQYRIVTKHGDVKWIEHVCMPVYDTYGEFVGIRSSNTDISSRKESEEQLEYLSLRDKLTDLYNRAFLESEMERLESGRAYPVTIIVADLDGLKVANDSFGHRKGDELLIAAADLMRRCLRKEDILARVGGDEFIALMPATDNKSGEAVANRIQQAVDSYNEKPDDIPLSISVGVYTTEGPEVSLVKAMRRADDHMYEAKRARKRRSLGSPDLGAL